ncbi:Spo0E like sporulation regulatory protein [Paenibacillus sp. NAIST15-1]|nr:Spo0E like sporulation regulatory protein [Paenibacillus sp. NAIST15-1]
MCYLHCPHDLQMLEKIERLKKQLISIVNEKNDFKDDEVVRISQELDLYLLDYQKKRLFASTSTSAVPAQKQRKESMAE